MIRDRPRVARAHPRGVEAKAHEEDINYIATDNGRWARADAARRAHAGAWEHTLRVEGVESLGLCVTFCTPPLVRALERPKKSQSGLIHF